MESIEDHKTLGVVRKIEANMSLRAANVFEIKKYLEMSSKPREYH